MTAYNKSTPARHRGRSPVTTPAVPTGTTHEGHTAYSRDAKSELFVTAVNTFGEQKTFYEKGNARRERIVNLTRQVAVQDPVWMLQFVRWLRNDANIRSTALVGGLEAAEVVSELDESIHQRLEQNPLLGGQGLTRQLTKAGISRPDEIGEAMAYWNMTRGKHPSGGVQRGLADKVLELYNEYSLLKYDTASHGFRFGDVIELVRPKPQAPWQSDLFRYAIERRHNRGSDLPESLPMIREHILLRGTSVGDALVLLDPDRLRRAGMTWEDVLSLAGSWLDKKLLWESMIPSMGYMALLRNLRNFDQAGISNDHAQLVGEILSDPAQVARSRQLPMRFLTAYRNAPSLRWSWPLEQALNLSLSNIPELGGNTLILVDTSGSMGHRFSDKSTLQRWDVAALFGVALAQRCERANVASFSGTYRQFPLMKDGTSLLKELGRWQHEGFNLNGGTDTVRALQGNVNPSIQRVVIITDEQASGGYDASGRRRYGYGLDQEHYLNEVNRVVSASMPLHVINVAGYEKGMVPSGQDNRHVYAGLTDQVFKLIPVVEAGQTGRWPWETE